MDLHKTLPLFLLMILTVVSLAAAQGGPPEDRPGTQETDCGDPAPEEEARCEEREDRRQEAERRAEYRDCQADDRTGEECLAAYCDDAGQDDEACKAYEERQEHREEARERREEHREAFREARLRDPRHVGLDVDADNNTFTDYTVDGLRVIDRGSYLGTPEEVEVERRGSTLEIEWDDDRLRIHDNPTGLLTYKGGRDENGSFLIDFSDDAVITPRGNDTYRVHFGDRFGVLVAPNATWQNNDTVVTQTFLSFHLTGAGRPPQDDEDDHDEFDDSVQAAIARRHVAAQVYLRGAAVTTVAPAENDTVEVQTYDDVEISIDAVRGPASRDDPLRVEVSAELEEGRTIVLAVEHGLLRSDELELRYFDVHDDGSETEVVFRRADSLEDVLDPTDDDGMPEYWVVWDEDGAQVLVSVPHWSVHAITISSVLQPSVLIGVAAGVAGAAVAAVGLFWPRRRED